MKTPLLNAGAVPAAGRAYSASIALIRARGMSVHARVLFHASATLKATIEVYTSPDGNNWDTTPYGSFDINVSAGNERQASAYIVAPEHGFIKLAVYNTDTAYALTWAKLWYTIQSYPNGTAQEHGSVLKDEGA